MAYSEASYLTELYIKKPKCAWNLAVHESILDVAGEILKERGI